VSTAPGSARNAAALAACRTSTRAALKRVHDALAQMKREKTPVTIAAVSRRAGVSRTFLYDNPQARAAVTGAAAQHGTRRAQDLATRDTGQEASWRGRALNAEDALKAARAEIIAQRTRIGELLGQVRDLESEWAQDTAQRITTRLRAAPRSARRQPSGRDRGC
jgi:hypothetical protein